MCVCMLCDINKEVNLSISLTKHCMIVARKISGTANGVSVVNHYQNRKDLILHVLILQCRARREYSYHFSVFSKYLIR